MKNGCNRFAVLKWLTCLAVAAWLTPSLAQEPAITVDSQVDKSKITIGDLITYSVVVRYSPEIVVTSPELGENLGRFEIRDFQIHDPVRENGLTVERIDYVISTFDTGAFEIPPLTFFYQLPEDSTRHELKTQPLKIEVESLKPSEAGDIRDVKDPLELPRDFTKILIWSAVVAGLLLLAVGLYVWHRRRSGKQLLPGKVEPPKPAHEVALDALRALQESDLLASGAVKAYYVRVSEIIRQYIEGRYFVPALELTTYELMFKLQQAEINPQETELIGDFLEKCDLVKFAKYRPGDDENREILDRAFEIVDATKLIYDQAESETPETETPDTEGGALPQEAVAAEEPAKTS